MTNFKIIESTLATFANIIVPFDVKGKNIGDNVVFLGHSLEITQIGSSIVGLANNENVFVLQVEIHK